MSTESKAPASLTLAHLQEYPTVNAAVDYANSFPIVQRVSSFTLPYVSAAHERSQPLLKHASPVLTRADQLGDYVLTSVDSKLPLKTTSPEDVIELAKKPIVSLRTAADTYKTAASTAAQERVIKPIQQATSAVKNECVARSNSVVDPLLKPVNEKLESMLNEYLPASEKEAAEAASVTAADYELGRTVQLAVTAVKRAKPVLCSQATTTRTHVQEVYDAKVGLYAKETSGVQTTVYASIATAKQLSTEGVALAGGMLHKQ